MLSKRPILILNKSKFDKAVELLTFLCLAACWLVVAISFNQLPDIIPVHYDLKGNIDNHGAKETIWILPFIGTAVITGIYILNKYPHYFNYMVEINEQNAEAQYRSATKLLRFIQLGVAIIFLVIVIDLILSAKTGRSFLGASFVPAVLLLFIVPVIVSMIRKNKKKAATEGRYIANKKK